MKNYIKLNICIAFTVLFNNKTQAQSQLSFFHLGDYVQQTSDISPVYIPKNSFTLGLPGASVSINSELPYNQIFTLDESNNDNVDLNLSNIINKTQGEHFNLSINESLNILSLTFKNKSSSFSLFANQKAIIDNNFSKNGLFNFFDSGLATAGNNILFNDELNNTVYIETGLGLTKEFLNKKLAIGLRAKYLIGIANASTIDDGVVSIGVDNEDYSWTLNSKNAGVRTAGIEFSDEFNLEEYEFSATNTGFGFDIGATYKITPKLTVELAVNDIGSITWKENVNQYLLDDTNVKIEKLDLGSDGDLEEEFIENLEAAANGREEKGGTYKTSLATTSYLSANYQLGRIHQFRATMFNRHTVTDAKPAFALGYNIGFKRTTYGVLAIRDELENTNLGLNFATKLGPLQIYAASDNVISVLSNFDTPEEISSANVRVGVNFVFGYNKWLKKQEK